MPSGNRSQPTDVEPTQLAKLVSSLDTFLRRYEAVVLVAFSMAYFAATLAACLRRPPWMDEVITLYDSRLPFHSMLALMKQGVDSTPPLNYLLLKSLFLITAPSPFLVRLPAAIGFWGMLICLYFFLRRFAPSIYALAGALYPMVTFPYFYSSEGRPYGLLLGFMGLIVLCWQSRIRRPGSKAWLWILGIASLGACFTHYYALVLIYPVVLGECVRTLQRRKLDLGVWAALLSGAVAIPVQLPLIRGLAKFALSDAARPAYFAHPSIKALFDTYHDLLFPAIFSISAVLCLALVFRAAFLHGGQEKEDTSSLPEMVMAAGFVSIPTVILVLCLFTHGAYLIRYLAPAVLGFAIMLPIIVLRVARANWAGYASVAALALIFPLNWYTLSWSAEAAGRQKFLEISQTRNLPIAVAQGLDYMELSYTAPEDLRKQLHYVSVGPDVAARYTDPTDERIVSNLSGHVPFRVDTLDSFLEEHTEFIVFWRPAGHGSLLDVLAERGYRFELISHSGPYQLFYARKPESAAKP